MRGLFVTATDTGVGKTSVSCAIARLLVHNGVRLQVCKPVETGVDQLPVTTSDAERLKAAAHSPAPVETISPLRLPEPLAPWLSAKRNGISIDYSVLIQQIQQHCNSDFSVIEGAGGLLVPLCDGHTLRDLMVDLALPLLVVIRPDLGTLNHSLLTFEAARSAGLQIAGYLINRMPMEPGPAEAGVIETLANFCDVPCLGVLPEVAGDFDAQTEQLTDSLRLSPQCRPLRDWLERTSDEPR